MTESQDRVLGQLEGKLNALIQQVEVQRVESQKSRGGIYEKLDAIQRGLDKIDTRVTQTEARQKKTEETTHFVETIKQRAIGIALAVSFAFTLLGAGFVLGLQKLAKYFSP